MRYRLFGKSGLKVSEICLGTMTFGTEFGWGADFQNNKEIFNLFAEAGGNFIDTADYYTKGTSETQLGRLLEGHRNEYVLATKYSLSSHPHDPNAGGNHRKRMVNAVEASLKRLKTDYIDIYWVHAWDRMTPLEEVLRGLDDLARSGKILYIGASDTPAWVVSRANAIADLRGWTPFTGLQLEYSLVQREIEAEFFPMAETLDLAIASWSPLAMGFLTGKYSEHPSIEDRLQKNQFWADKYINERNKKIIQEVQAIAKELKATCAQVSLNWQLNRRFPVIPIVGAKSAEQLKDSLGCLELDLNEQHLERLEKASKIKHPFPNDFLETESVQKLLFGDCRRKIIPHRKSVC